VKSADVVIHLAHEGTPLSSDDLSPSSFIRNIAPTLNLLESIKRTRRRLKVIYFSSGGTVYGQSKERRPFSERDLCSPTTPYGFYKRTIEECLRFEASRESISPLILRVSNAYGKPLPPDGNQGLIGTTFSRLAAGRPIRLIGNPSNVRDYVHVEDICSAVKKAIEYENTVYEIFNIGTGIGYSVEEVLKLMRHQFGPFSIVEDASFTNATFLPNYCVLDIFSAKQLLGWEPVIDLAQGIEMMKSQFLQTHSHSSSR
jgi:UDP-glucose 4-epimerase